MIAGNAIGQNSISIPTDSKFVLQIDLQALKKSKIGSSLFEMAKEAALKEIGKNFNKDEVSKDKVQEVLGMDPFEEVQSIVICSSEYENPEKSMLGMVRLKQTTGNLEGLLLGLPGYESSKHGKYEIHSAHGDSPKEGVFYGAIHKNASGNHTLIMGASKQSVTGLLDSLDASLSSATPLKNVPLASDRKMLLSMQVLELPTTELGKGPQANIAALLKSVDFSISEEDDELELKGAMLASTDKQAEKIRQSIQGLSAMVELFVSMDDQDEDVQEAMKFLKKIKVTQEGESVKIKLRLPASQIAEMIKKEIADQ